MKILVVIVTYNGSKWIKESIQSILNSSISADIFVVDNNSTDNTLDIIKNTSKNAIVVEAKKNLGFGKANNIGLQYAADNDYDFVYLLNQDAYLEVDTLKEMVRISLNHPEYGILSPFQMEANKHHLDKNFIRIAFKWQYNANISEDFFFNKRAEVYQLPIVMAAHWLITKKCLSTVGGFSPTFAHYGEDNNYCDRVYYHGLKVGIVPTARGVHDREYRVDSKQKFMYVSAYMGILRVLSNPDASGLIRRLAMAYAFILGHYISLSPIKYIFKILLNWRTIRKNREKSKAKGAFLNFKDIG
jgi:GT2 family glycosyltransferase